MVFLRGKFNLCMFDPGGEDCSGVIKFLFSQVIEHLGNIRLQGAALDYTFTPYPISTEINRKQNPNPKKSNKIHYPVEDQQNPNPKKPNH